MVKKIIYYNRELTSLFVDLFNYMFCKINNCEDYFYSHINNELNGLWEYFYKNGTIREIGVYQNGMPIGEWNKYYENGTLSEKSIIRKL